MHISLNDCVARFIRKKEDCKNGKIKPSVFIPGSKATEISVFVISDLQGNNNKIWELGCQKLRSSIAGRADLIVSDIYDKGFGMQNGNDRHAGIIPIPKLPFPDNTNDPRNLPVQTRRREIANDLIGISNLHIK